MTASEMGALRWQGVGQLERRRLARKANRARNRSLLKRERKELARRAAMARWHKIPDKPGIEPQTPKLTL